MQYDLAIIGGGPAGAAAGVYASRKQLKTVLITERFGGQSEVSEDIQNWIGTVSITGAELAKNLEKHLRAYADGVVDIKTGSKVASLDKNENGFVVTTEAGDSFEAKTVLITAGSVRRKLAVPGAEEFDNKGLTYCASCDGPLFGGKDVIVVGGGNAAFETVAQLLAYVKSVTLINRTEIFKADEVTIEKIRKNPQVTVMTNTVLTEIKGDTFVNAVTYKNTSTEETGKLKTDGVFVEIGLIPNSEFAKKIVPVNTYGQIEIDALTQRTKTDGVWAAGDCTNGLYHQNNIAAGDAVKALEDIYLYVHKNHK
jgi:alkyl hydroperoxide reductase subunit F